MALRTRSTYARRCRQGGEPTMTVKPGMRTTPAVERYAQPEDCPQRAAPCARPTDYGPQSPTSLPPRPRPSSSPSMTILLLLPLTPLAPSVYCIQSGVAFGVGYRAIEQHEGVRHMIRTGDEYRASI